MPSPGWPAVPGSRSPSAAVGPAWRPGVVIGLLHFRWIAAAGLAGVVMARVGSAVLDSVRHDGIGFFRLVPPVRLTRRRAPAGPACSRRAPGPHPPPAASLPPVGAGPRHRRPPAPA